MFILNMPRELPQDITTMTVQVSQAQGNGAWNAPYMAELHLGPLDERPKQPMGLSECSWIVSLFA